jgi:hypothetical protein
MNEGEAEQFAISPDDRHQYVRLDSAKVNVVPHAGRAAWFWLVSVPIGNGDNTYPTSDTVQAAEPWTPPSTWTDITVDTLNAALTEIDRGMANGQRYTDAAAARERAAWCVGAEALPQ